MFSDLGLYHDMDTVDKLNFYTENKEWKVTNPFRLAIIAFFSLTFFQTPFTFCFFFFHITIP